MRLRWSWSSGLRHVASFLTFTYPQAGVLLLAALSAREPWWRRWRLLAGWLAVWAPLLLLEVGHALAGTHPHGLAQGLLVLVAGCLLLLPVRPSLAGWAVTLALTVAGMAVERQMASSAWTRVGSTPSNLERLSNVFSGQRLSADPGVRATFERSWSGGGGGPLTLRFQARRAAGPQDAAWFQFHPGMRVEPLARAGFVRITPPPEGASYVTRRTDTGRAIASRTFRVGLEVRVSDPFTAEASSCVGVMLLEVLGTDAQACFEAVFEEGWVRHGYEWTAPASATSGIVGVLLRMPTTWYEVGDVRLEERIGEEWVGLGPLEPNGLRVALAVPGVATISWPHAVVDLDDAWQTYEVTMDGSGADQGRLRVVLALEPSSAVEIRGAVLEDAAGARLPAQATPPRARAWFNHPNLAGHATAMAALITMLASSTLLGAVAGSALGLLGVGLTASRTALVALLLGLSLLVGRYQGRRLGARAPLVIVAVVFLAVMALALTPLGARLLGDGFQDRSAVSRQEVAAFAGEIMMQSPLRGLAGTPFAQAWSERHPEAAGLPPSHAHNLWWQLGAQFGIPGFAAAVWLTLGLLALAWRCAGWPGLLLAGCVLSMQATDFTLLDRHMLLGLAFGLRLLTQRADRGDEAPGLPRVG